MGRVERLLDAIGDRIVHAALLSKPIAKVISQNSNSTASTLDRKMVVNPRPRFRRNVGVLSVAMLLLVLVPIPLAAQGNPTNTFVTASPSSPSEYLQLVTFTAMVESSFGGSPTGTVTFTGQGGFRLCVPVQLVPSCNSSCSIAVCSTATLPVGANTITAAYSGDSNYSPSNGSIPYTVNGNTPTTTLTVSPPSPVAGQVVTMTATVSNGGDPVISGSVTFLNSQNSEVLGTVELESQAGPAPGTATLKTRFAPGNYSVLASFDGTFGEQGSGAEADFSVTGTEPTITTLTDQADGNNWNFTATVFGFGFPAATGTASFTDLTTMVNLGSVGVAAPGTSSFQPQQTYGTGANPVGIAVGDFNGDGIPDLAVANLCLSDPTCQNASTVSILLGNGDGTFQMQQTYTVGQDPSYVAVGDFNGDGILDLAVTYTNGSTISVLLGNGNGTFQPQVTYAAGGSPTGIVVADFNGDGIADLAITNFIDVGGSGIISVFLGNGDGTFQNMVQYGVGAFPAGIAVADFNGDGIADVAVTNDGNGSGNTVSVLLGNGDGTFQQQVTYPTGTAPYGVAVGDFNGDGIADLAVTNTTDDTVGVLLGNGDGTFRQQVTYPTGATPIGIAVADFNGDGTADLAVTNNNANPSTVGVLLGNGDGTFQPQQTYTVGSTPIGIVGADFNGDGVPDLAAANEFATQPSVSVLLGGTVTSGQIQNVPVIGSGVHMIQSTYTPTQDFYTGSLSNIVSVNGSGTKVTPPVTLTANPLEVNQGNSVFFSVNVGSSAGLIPTGTVTFIDGTTALATVTLDAGGDANYSNATLVLGQHSITAMYNGDSNFNSATSPAVAVQVDTPFVLQSTSYSGTLSPGGQTQLQINVIAAYQSNPLIYAAISCMPPAGSGITCSVSCPHNLPSTCSLYSDSEQVTVTINASSGTGRLVLPLHRGEDRVIAAFAGLSGIGLVGLVFIPMRARRRAAIGTLFLLIVVLCFGTSCGNFAPGISSSPVNNVFYISVTADLREQLSSSQMTRSLGVQQFWYTLLIK